MNNIILVCDLDMTMEHVYLRLVNMGYTEVTIATPEQVKDRGLTINSLPESMSLEIKSYQPISFFDPNPRKDKSKRYTEQPWRNRYDKKLKRI